MAIPGKQALQILTEKGGGSWAFTEVPEIFHDMDISAVCWNSEGIRLLTFCVNKTFKLWNFETMSLLQYFDADQPIYNCKYSFEGKAFGFLTHDGYFGVWKDQEDTQQNEFQPTLLISEYDEEPEKPQKQPKLKTRKSLKTALEDDEDYDEIDRLLNAQKKDGEMAIEGEASEKEDNNEDVPATLDGEKVQEEDGEEEEKLEKKKSNVDLEEIAKEIMAEKPVPETVQERPVYETRRRQNKHADVIDVAMQHLLYPSSTSLTKNKKFLCWNLVGNIVLRY